MREGMACRLPLLASRMHNYGKIRLVHETTFFDLELYMLKAESKAHCIKKTWYTVAESAI